MFEIVRLGSERAKITSVADLTVVTSSLRFKIPRSTPVCDNRVVQNQAIEIHDSVLDQITLESGLAVLHFPKVYIHSSVGRPGIDEGTGWVQEAFIRIGNAHIEGMFSPESRESYGGDGYSLYDGCLLINGSVSDNLIPIPLDVQGDIELRLECWGEVVRVRGSSARLELIGTAEYVEEFHPSK